MNNTHIAIIAVIVVAAIWWFMCKNKGENYTRPVPAWLQGAVAAQNAAAKQPLNTDYNKNIVKGCNVKACTDVMQDYQTRKWYWNTANLSECKNCPQLDTIAYGKSQYSKFPANFYGTEYDLYNPQLGMNR